jgi:hypothetical protein
MKIGRQTLSTLVSTLADLCFLVTDLCRAAAKVAQNSLCPFFGVRVRLLQNEGAGKGAIAPSATTSLYISIDYGDKQISTYERDHQFPLYGDIGRTMFLLRHLTYINLCGGIH